MAKPTSQYQCLECASILNKWSGQCPDCKAWNCIQQIQPLSSSPNRNRGNWTEHKTTTELVTLSSIPDHTAERFSSQIDELDRVLGGGIVHGSVILLGGDPGIGKSTILLQCLTQVSQQLSTLYVTGEESLQQVNLRAKRLELPRDKLKLLSSTCVEEIIAHAITLKPGVIVIDSIQTIYTDGLQSAPGSISQIRESTALLVRLAKQHNIAIFLVGHVTKDGQLAGPRVLEHMVDTVLYFEGDSSTRYRVIRAVKNRFGAVNELGIFAMTDQGLKTVTNPSAIFLSNHEKPVAGSIIMVSREGTRPILVEIQSLVTASHLGNPRRISVGLESNRLAMLLAVLQRHGGIPLYDQDVFINAVGGVRISETGADLAVILAILSSYRDKPVSNRLLVFGEVGLSGEIRPVPNGEERLKEGSKHGFETAIIPAANKPRKNICPNMKLIPVNHLADALNAL
ncbi:MAG: DNA repair protein RadA [Gammaproteobacteria bacterium]|nr:DNA repair protein RadA [Gammaproteobacteria bacterium]MBL6999928.1 DNA repair protein RadA [Gammaproteobacteria bacterium]